MFNTSYAFTSCPRGQDLWDVTTPDWRCLTAVINPFYRLFLLSVLLCYGITPAWAQRLPTTAIASNLGGTGPVVGLSLHQRLAAFPRRDSTAIAFLEGSLGLGYLPHPCVLFGSCDQTGLSFSHTLRLIRGKARWQAELGYAGLLKDQDYFFSHQAYFPGFSGGVRVKISSTLTAQLYTVGYLYRRTTLMGSLTGELTRTQSRHVLLWPGVSFLIFL